MKGNIIPPYAKVTFYIQNKKKVTSRPGKKLKKLRVLRKGPGGRSWKAGKGCLKGFRCAILWRPAGNQAGGKKLVDSLRDNLA